MPVKTRGPTVLLLWLALVPLGLSRGMAQDNIAQAILAGDDRFEKMAHDELVSRKESSRRFTESPRLEAIGARLVPYCSRPVLPYGLAYTFKIDEDEGYNAYTLPGGAIYVGRALYDDLDDDELAFIVGHEVTHAAERHVVKDTRAELTYLLVKQPVLMLYAPALRGFVDSLLGLAYEAASSEHSRDQEVAADRGGVLLAAKAGYDVDGAARAIEKADARIGAYTSCVKWCSHPEFADRLEAVSRLARSLKCGPSDASVADILAGRYRRVYRTQVIDGRTRTVEDRPAENAYVTHDTGTLDESWATESVEDIVFYGGDDVYERQDTLNRSIALRNGERTIIVPVSAIDSVIVFYRSAHGGWFDDSFFLRGGHYVVGGSRVGDNGVACPDDGFAGLVRNANAGTYRRVKDELYHTSKIVFAH